MQEFSSFVVLVKIIVLYQYFLTDRCHILLIFIISLLFILSQLALR